MPINSRGNLDDGDSFVAKRQQLMQEDFRSRIQRLLIASGQTEQRRQKTLRSGRCTVEAEDESGGEGEEFTAFNYLFGEKPPTHG